MSGPGPKILAIDDEVAVLRLLKTLLGRLGYEVTTCESSQEALALLERTSYDCVITDAIMPELSGYDLVKRLRSHPRHANLPVLMLTRKRHRQDVKEAVEAGVTDYILKPLDENLLVEKVEHCLKNSGRALSHESSIAADAEISLGCQIVSIGESSMTVRLHSQVEAKIPFRLQSRLFAKIGIHPPDFKLKSCEMKSSEEHPDLPWEAQLTFSPLAETEATHLHAWLQKQKK
jgi:DNA-binding response OmpR family regulator